MIIVTQLQSALVELKHSIMKNHLLERAHRNIKTIQLAAGCICK